MVPPLSSPASTAAADGPWAELNARGLAFAAIADWPQASAAFGDAVALLSQEVLGGAPPDALALVLSNLAHACARDGHPEAAIDHAQRALALRESLGGRGSPLAARTRMDLAVLLASSGRLDDARGLMEESLADLEAGLGANDPRLAGALENAARLALMTGAHARAASAWRRLHDIVDRHEMPTARLAQLGERLAAAGITLPGAPPEVDALPFAAGPFEPITFEPPFDESVTFEPPSFETPSFEVPSFETPSFETPSFEVPSFEVPSFEAPSFEAPSFEVPSFEDPTLDHRTFEASPFEIPTREFPTSDASPFEAPPVELPVEPPTFATPTAGATPSPWDTMDDADVAWEMPDTLSTPEAPLDAWPAPPAEAHEEARAEAAAQAETLDAAWEAAAAEAVPAEPEVSPWHTMFGDIPAGSAAEPDDAAHPWGAPPSAAGGVSSALDEPLPWMAADNAMGDSAALLDDDVAWLEGPDAPAPRSAGRLLEEPEPEIPEFLRLQRAEEEPAPMPVPMSAPAPSPFPASAATPTPVFTTNSGEKPLATIVPEAATWGRTGSATPHDGSIAVSQSPMNKYEEILQRVRRQALNDRTRRARRPLSPGRLAVLSVIAVALVGVGGASWWLLLN